MKTVAPINSPEIRVSAPQLSVQQETIPKVSFKEVLGTVGGGFHAELNHLQKNLISGAKVAPEKLLLYQIKVGQFGMRVELVSKIAESMLSTVRRLQSTQ